MRFYETTIVLSPTADDAAIEREIEKVTQTVAADQGRMVTTQKWGVKRMAYPIAKHAQACYVHFVYQATPSVPGKLESMFRINENVLRHLTVLVEGPLASKRGEQPVAPGEMQAQPTAPVAPEPAPAPAAAPAGAEDAAVGVSEKPEQPQ